MNVVLRGQFAAIRDEFEAGVCGPKSVVEQVVNNERDNHQAASEHHACGEARHLMLGHCVSFGPSGFVCRHQRDGRHKVGDEGHDESDPHDPESFWDRVQECGILIDLLRPCEDLEITGEVAEHEADER